LSYGGVYALPGNLRFLKHRLQYFIINHVPGTEYFPCLFMFATAQIFAHLSSCSIMLSWVRSLPLGP